MNDIEKKLYDLYQLKLPEPAAPAGVYTPAMVTGNLLYVSGQIPTYNGEKMGVGRLGEDASVEDGQAAARYCLMNILAQAKSVLGSFDRISKFVQLIGFVQCTPDFHDQVQVVNGASQMLLDLFGDAGLPTRMALGTNSIPGNYACELLAVIEIKP